MKKLLPILVILGLGLFALDRLDITQLAGSGVATSDAAIAEAFENRRSDMLVEGRGEVIRMLADDNEGDRHQRFILRLGSGQTLLIAHNIDLAPRLPDLKVGDAVEFAGEYEWNEQGGVVHWTHHDPRGQHRAGWLKFDGRMYQ